MKRFILAVSAFASSLLLGACDAKVHRAPLKDIINAKGDLHGSATALPENWFTKDPEKDGVEGMSVDRAYKELGLKMGVAPVVVAVIDSGVDIDHEDLQGHIWTNEAEAHGVTGVDDDTNGFVDDIHGWNFLGSYKDGKPVNLVPTTLEVTRETVRMKKLKAQREADGQELTKEEQAYLDKIQNEVETEYQVAQQQLEKNTKIKNAIAEQYEIIKDVVKVSLDDLTRAEVEAIESDNQQIIDAKNTLLQIFEKNHIPDVARVNRRLAYYGDEAKYYFNEDFDPRAEIIGDDPNNTNDHNYGNNDVKGSDGEHGTHVSGMIAAVRDNGIGIDGIATDVRIMPVRAIPNGDEYDKDIANAVRYAVDNGARIINMSFGKGYSPHKDAVDRAFEYAASKGVLMVHAAGNDSQNNDQADNFPNRHALDGTLIGGWLEVGASDAHKNETLPAVFSNYGKQSVDLFAPGVDIKSTVPERNKYDTFSGTSMASPSTAGVAALILSQNPKLSGPELKEILMKSVRQYPGLQVNIPGQTDPNARVEFSELSVSGGIVDAMAALRLALGI